VNADGVHTYFYDAENRLIQVDGTLGNCNTANACYAYDAQDHRVRKLAGGLALDYYYDLDGRYVSQVRSDGVWWRGEIYAGGRHLATYDNSTTTFDLADWLGTERVRSTLAGPACETIQSLPFGDGEVINGSCGSYTPDASPLHFTGKERDSESNLDNFGARYFTSQMGRFMSPNPTGGRQAFPQSWNAYTYVLNNPLNAVDPNGLDCVYLNDAGNGIESIDNNSNAGECQQNGGAWAPGTITNVTFDPNSNDVLLGYANQGNNGNVDYSQITATPGQFNPGDEIYGLANDINQMNLTSNIFKIYGAGAAVGATGGTACYFFCGTLGIGTVTTVGATVGGTAGPLVTDPRLQNIVNWLFQETDELPGGTAGAVTYEQKMGDLLSSAGHLQKAQDAIADLNSLLKSGTLSFNDQLAARQMIQQLQTAIATKPFGQN
jgi:RHS repeat-associated protein